MTREFRSFEEFPRRTWMNDNLFELALVQFQLSRDFSAFRIAVGLRATLDDDHATAATNAFSNEGDITKVQEWLGHANVSTLPLTRL